MRSVLLLVVLTACATPQRGPWDRLAARAEAVFVGEVVSVEVRLSAGPDPVPFSFVTFDVHQDLRGAGEQVTLRFLGGAWPDGRVLRVSELPEVVVGGRYLVFAEGNGEHACPLVDCAAGLVALSPGPLAPELEVAVSRSGPPRPLQAVDKDQPFSFPQPAALAR